MQNMLLALVQLIFYLLGSAIIQYFNFDPSHCRNSLFPWPDPPRWPTLLLQDMAHQCVRNHWPRQRLQHGPQRSCSEQSGSMPKNKSLVWARWTHGDEMWCNTGGKCMWFLGEHWLCWWDAVDCLWLCHKEQEICGNGLLCQKWQEKETPWATPFKGWCWPADKVRLSKSIIMGVSKNGGTPKCMVYKGKSYYCKIDDLGILPFMEPPIYLWPLPLLIGALDLMFFTLVDTFPSQHACMGGVKSFGIP